ncbi:IS4 family transposase [Aeoliella sp. ICT_H6.2]|uniref:IS4 family transposase n=1 Tax=Aeoliella straminimaris TaxID=2954799 RepID=A0A9X2FJB6_9BACT|nr:IS4 family transposase [Aeoliella straminimaris]MCO6046936.1 IS4 family transposase [Aeoliella straminimaris]
MASLDAVRARFARNEGLPFADVLTETSIRDVLHEHGVQYRDRVFNPVTTIWGFLSQVLSEDHSCRDAVSRIIAHRATSGQAVCSPNTSSYCDARSRLFTGVLSTLAKQTAEELQMSIDRQWKWNGRSVFIVDGSTVSMPDTPENQQEYPQPPIQKPGLGFPLARIAVLLSLATGACHDLEIASYQGKGTGEKSLFRRMYDTLQPGDVVVADALFDDYFITWELYQRNIDIVARAQCERVGSRILERSPKGDLLVWQRPSKPRGMTKEQYRSYPESLVMRQVAVDARDRNNRVTQFKVVTTLLNESIDGQQIGHLYERRWEGEVDIRSIKSTMQMDILRCKTPDMVHKEIWTHLLAYNLLRTVMAVAADENDTEPRKVSFKGAKQALMAFAPKIEAARPEDRATLIDAMLTTIAYHRVGNRPGRWEPRARKRRPKHAARLTQPRHIAKLPQNRSKWF